MLSFVDAVGHLSFVLSALSFIMRDMLMLRSVALVSAAVGIYYNYAIPAGPLWLVIFWLSVFSAIHIYRIVEQVHRQDVAPALGQAVGLADTAENVVESVTPLVLDDVGECHVPAAPTLVGKRDRPPARERVAAVRVVVDLDLLLLLDPAPRGLASQVLYLRPDGKPEVLRS